MAKICLVLRDTKETHFKYLGLIKTEDESCLQDIKARIAMAKQKMIQLNI